MTETNETPAPEPESRQVRRARERKAEKDGKRRAQLAGAPIKKARRNQSLRGTVQVLQRTMAGLLIELRSMTAGLQQQQDLVNVLLECLARKALNQETEDDRTVLAEFLDEAADARTALEQDKAEAEKAAADQAAQEVIDKVTEGLPEMSESLFAEPDPWLEAPLTEEEERAFAEGAEGPGEPLFVCSDCDGGGCPACDPGDRREP